MRKTDIVIALQDLTAFQKIVVVAHRQFLQCRDGLWTDRAVFCDVFLAIAIQDIDRLLQDLRCEANATVDRRVEQFFCQFCIVFA